MDAVLEIVGYVMTLCIQCIVLFSFFAHYWDDNYY